MSPVRGALARGRPGARRRVAAGLAAFVAVGLITAGTAPVHERSTGADRAPLADSAVPAPPALQALPAPPVPVSPKRVRIAAIGVETGLEALGVDSAGVLRPPSDYRRAGWFAGGPAPGELGPAVIVGHVDSQTGPAVFYRLRHLLRGDLVEVDRDGQWVAFRVVATEHYPKERFPTERVYRPTPVPELRLITCSGTFDHRRRSYHDNLIVYAVAA